MDRSKSKTAGLIASAIFGALIALPGCIVDDRNGSRGQENAPTANVPDSGSPIRRESAAKTLHEGDPDAPASGSLEVEKK